MYQPGILDASSIDALADSLRNELDKLALSLSQPTDYLSLQTIYSEPKRALDGMVIKADGVLWNPGAGAGVYARISGTWTKL